MEHSVLENPILRTCALTQGARDFPAPRWFPLETNSRLLMAVSRRNKEPEPAIAGSASPRSSPVRAWWPEGGKPEPEPGPIGRAEGR